MRLAFLAAAAAATVIITSAATAADSRAVAYGDLNLAKPAGAATLKQRVRAAATNVCGARNAQDLASANRARACVDDAMTGATPAVARAIATARGA